jgi:hypothetical protein
MGSGAGGEREGVEWVVREGVGEGGEMTQALYAHMNNKTIKIKKILECSFPFIFPLHYFLDEITK